MKPYLKELGKKTPYYISAYPNAGLLTLWDSMMGLRSMSPQIAEFIDEGLVNIVGGCCGTTDEFIRKYDEMARGKQPHVPVAKSSTMWLSGLELLDVTLLKFSLSMSASVAMLPETVSSFVSFRKRSMMRLSVLPANRLLMVPLSLM